MAKYKVTVNQGSRLPLHGGEAGGDAELREIKVLKRFAIYPKGSEVPCTPFMPLDTLVYYMLGVMNSESTIKKIKNG